MGFNEIKVLKLFRVKSSDIIKTQIEEIKQTAEDYTERNTYGSGIHLNALRNLYSKHLETKLQLFIDSIFEQVGERYNISVSDEENCVKIISDKVGREIKNKQDDIKAIMASSGLDKGSIVNDQVVAVVSILNSAKFHKIDQMKLLVEKHNNHADELKKSRSFWQDKHKTIRTIAEVITAISGIFIVLNAFGFFTKK